MSTRFSAFFLILTLFFLSPAASSLRADQEVLDGVAAVVNGDVITFSQVRDLVGTRERALQDQYKGQELIDKVKELRLSAVQILIDNQLILQEFKKNKFTMPDYVVDDHIQTVIREQFGGDRAAFVRTLEAQGMTLARFREQEKDRIIVQAMRQKSVKDDTIVSPHEIEDYYAKNRDTYSTPEQVHLRMIVIKKAGESGKRMAEEVRQKVLGGADFDKLAQMYSEDPTTQDAGGDWGWIDRKTLNDSLTKIAFSLKPGEVSNVVELAGSYYLLYVEAKKEGSTKSIAAVHDDIENKLLQDERQKAEEKWIASLREKAYIKTF